MPDAQWNGAAHFVDGDRGVTQWTFTATRPDGTKISSAGCDLFVFRDGLIYWVDNRTGLHVARYNGPRADELPGPGSGVYEGNATSPHR